MADVASIILVQSFTYRGNAEEWSNRYHLTGPAPTDDAGWQAVSDAIWDALSPCLPSRVTLVRAYGHTSDTTPAVATIDYTVSPLTPPAGTSGFDLNPAPGDAAMTVRWDTGRRNTKGKKIYLRKYFHGVDTGGSGAVDAVNSTIETNLQDFGDAMLAELGSTGQFMAGPDGEVPVSAQASPWVTTRTLKRRGRRPPS